MVIAAYLPPDWDVCYIDENYKDINFDIKFDFVCISSMTVQATRAYEIAKNFREKGILTVIGGIHATIMPEEAMQYGDVIIAGEGEVLFPKFLKDYINGKYLNLYIEEKAAKYDLSRCITPKYELIKGYDYPIVNIYTTRGCPRKCNFCCASNVYGLKYRRKTNKQILNEIDLINSLYPDRLILFADDNLLIMKKQSIDLLEKLVSKNVRWIAQTDISIADDNKMLELMYVAGCQWIVIGFESVSEKSLRNIEDKNFKYKYVHAYGEKVRIIRSYGIKVYGTFIVGLDEDDKSVFDNTADFILENQLYGANITVPTPLPGTLLRQKMVMENRIINNKWSDYTLWDVVVKPKNMSISELEEGLLYTYRKISEGNNVNNRLKNLMKDMRNHVKRGIKFE